MSYKIDDDKIAEDLRLFTKIYAERGLSKAEVLSGWRAKRLL